MSDSPTIVPQIATQQAQPEVIVNQLIGAASPALAFGMNHETTAALTWGYHGGTINNGGTLTKIPNGTVALTASTTNYVQRTVPGVVSVNTSAFTTIPLYTIITNGTGVLSFTDWRHLEGNEAAAGGVTAIGSGGTGETTAQDAIDALSDVSSGTNGDVLTMVAGSAEWQTPTVGTGGGAANAFDGPKYVTGWYMTFANGSITAFNNSNGMSQQGSLTAVSPSGASLFETMMSGYLTSTAAINTNAGCMPGGGAFVTRLIANALGAFKADWMWGFHTGAAGNRVRVGLQVNNGNPSATNEPSVDVSCIMFAADSTDTNLQVMHNDGSGTCTKIDLGASFPKSGSLANFYFGYFEWDGVSTVTYHVTNLVTGAVATGTITTNLPAAGTNLFNVCHGNTGSSAAAIAFAIRQALLVRQY